MYYKGILDRIETQLEGGAHLDELAKKKQDPFKILISTILSARTRDANTKIATEELFAKFNRNGAQPSLLSLSIIGVMEGNTSMVSAEIVWHPKSSLVAINDIL